MISDSPFRVILASHHPSLASERADHPEYLERRHLEVHASIADGFEIISTPNGFAEVI